MKPVPDRWILSFGEGSDPVRPTQGIDDIRRVREVYQPVRDFFHDTRHPGKGDIIFQNSFGSQASKRRADSKISLDRSVHYSAIWKHFSLVDVITTRQNNFGYQQIGVAEYVFLCNFRFMSDEALINDQEYEAMRRRLIAIRKLVTGDNQSEFARMLIIHPNRWNNIERGSPLTLRIAMQIEKQTGLPIEYITWGNTTRLTSAKKRQLAEFERSLNK